MIFIITFLIIIGQLKLFQFTATLFAQGITDRVNDDILNPIGIAYLNSLLILLLFWLFKNAANKTLKFLITISMLLTLFVLISTLSRASMLFLVIIFMLYNFRGYRLKLLLFKD